MSFSKNKLRRYRSSKFRIEIPDEDKNNPDLQKAIYHIESLAEKLDRAESKIPIKKQIQKHRVYDEVSGKVRSQYSVEETEIPPKNFSSTSVGSFILQSTSNLIHSKIQTVDNENAAVDAAHRSERMIEQGVWHGNLYHKYHKYQRQKNVYDNVRNAENNLISANSEYLYQKTMQEHPELYQKSSLSHLIQKKRIQREYQQAIRDKARNTVKDTAKAVSRKASEIAKKAVAAIAKHPMYFIIPIAVLLLTVLIFTGITMGISVVSGAVSSVLGTSYLAEEQALLDAEDEYKRMEKSMEQTIDDIEQQYPDFDEYRYKVDSIEHDPYVLASILTVLYPEYNDSDIANGIQSLFYEQYSLSLVRITETRYKTVTRTKTYTDADGNVKKKRYKVKIAYPYYILEVKLDNTDLDSLVSTLFDTEQQKLYQRYMETKGNFNGFSS